MLRRMASVYLETSFFSVCVSSRDDDKIRGWRASNLDWWEHRRHEHRLFISREVIAELSAIQPPRRQAALDMVQGLEILPIEAAVQDLAELLVRHLAMPGPSKSGDAIHVATAIHYNVDAILTWNIKHLVNPLKWRHLVNLGRKHGFQPAAMITADML